jgi:hypothetical protein
VVPDARHCVLLSPVPSLVFQTVTACRRLKEAERAAARSSCGEGSPARWAQTPDWRALESKERSVPREGRRRFTAVRGGGPCGQVRVVLELHAEELRIGRRAEQPARPHLMQVSGDDGLRAAITRCLPPAQSGGEEGAATAEGAFQACQALRGCALWRVAALRRCATLPGRRTTCRC